MPESTRAIIANVPRLHQYMDRHPSRPCLQPVEALEHLNRPPEGGRVRPAMRYWLPRH